MTHRALPRSATISREALSPYSPAPSHFCYDVTASVLPEDRLSIFHLKRDATSSGTPPSVPRANMNADGAPTGAERR